MKAKNLRIGNLVDLYGSIATVQRFDFNDRPPNGLAVDKGKPIPLTEDWLTKFGFNKFPNQKKYDTDDFWACSLRNGNEWHFEDLECIIRYVHELQNLFFALTGSELKLK